MAPLFFVLIGIGALCAMLGAMHKRRASYVLLVSAAIGLFLRWTGMDFSLWLWAGVDFAAIAAICWPTAARPKPWRRDWIVLAYYVPLFATYFVPSQAGSDMSAVLVALQMMMTLPVKQLAERWRHTAVNHHTWSDFDLRVSHEEA
jgi:hypothetical protein